MPSPFGFLRSIFGHHSSIFQHHTDKAYRNAVIRRSTLRCLESRGITYFKR